MKKIHLILLSAGLYTASLITAQNPYAGIGKTSKPMLTLSAGKYPEHFENDNIRQVGSVMVNIKTEQIVAFIDKKEEITPRAHTSSRFLSTDPMARHFPMLTPYQFASNRPIDGLDLDGLEYVTYTIYVQNGKTTKIEKTTDYELRNGGKAGKQYNYVYLDDNNGDPKLKDRFEPNKSKDYGIFGGKNNPLIPKVGSDPTKTEEYEEDFTLDPLDEYDAAYKEHDKGFKEDGITDKAGTFSAEALESNKKLVDNLKTIKAKRQAGEKDNVTHEKYSAAGAKYAAKALWLFQYILKKNEKNVYRKGGGAKPKPIKAKF